MWSPDGCPAASNENDCWYCRVKAALSSRGADFVDACLEQRALSAGIDDRRTERAKIGDGALHEIDALLVGFAEQLLVQVLADHPDAQTIEPPGRRGADIGP